VDRVLLMGLMGTGKTTVGRRVAARLGVPFLDNDDLVHEATGRERDELLRAGGEGALRAAESAALGVALDRPGPLVANVAAGVVLDGRDRRRLREADALVVWLRARPETLAARTADDHERASRPWLGDDPVAVFRTMEHDRDRWYAEVADVVIDVDDLSPDEVAARIPALGSAGCDAPPERPPA
jgi:shikimate kinase